MLEKSEFYDDLSFLSEYKSEIVSEAQLRTVMPVIYKHWART